MSFDYYRNPFPANINNHLEILNNTVSDINKYIRDLRKNYKGLENINNKNARLDLDDEILDLENGINKISYEIAKSKVLEDLQAIRNDLRIMREKYGTHETIRRQRREDYVNIVAYPPWDIIYDKVMGLGGDVHVNSIRENF